MKRITDKEFLETTPDMDSIVAIRVENGKFYFHAWMSQYIGLLDGHTECNIQYAYNPFTCNIAREDLTKASREFPRLYRRWDESATIFSFPGK